MSSSTHHQDPAVERAWRAFLSSPHDRDRRNAYVRALPDGDPRKRLVSVQLALRSTLSSSERRDRLEEQRELLAKHSATWAAEVAPMVDEYWFERGFLEHVRLSAAALARHANALYAAAPVLHVDLTGAGGKLGGLAQQGALGRLCTLSLRASGITDADVAELVSAPLPHLRWLDLRDNGLGMAALEALAASANIPVLARAEFSGNRVADPFPSIAGAGFDGTIGDLELNDVRAALVAKHGEQRWYETDYEFNPRPRSSASFSA